MPMRNFREIMALIREEKWSPPYEMKNALGDIRVPLDLLVLGSLRYMGRGVALYCAYCTYAPYRSAPYGSGTQIPYSSYGPCSQIPYSSSSLFFKVHRYDSLLM